MFGSTLTRDKIDSRDVKLIDIFKCVEKTQHEENT